MIATKRIKARGHTSAENPRLRAPRRESKRRANLKVLPSGHLPASANQGAEAMSVLSPMTPLPPPPNNGKGDGLRISATPTAGAVSLLRECQSQRVATMRMQMRIDNACGSLVRRAMGWRFDMPEKEREAPNAAAESLVEAIQTGGEIPTEHASIASAVSVFCIASVKSREPFDNHRANLEKRMREAAESLPVAPWVEGVKGFGLMGLAIIVGEAGDLSNYANPAKLWKRMGLAVFDGKSQRKSTDAELAKVMGYNPRRRSASWTIIDSLLRQPGPYQDLYRARRAYELERHPEFDKGIDKKTGKQKVTIHCDRRSRRYAEKRLLRDLWRAWRDAR